MTSRPDSTRDNLLDLVFKDDLTKLYNRRYYNRRYQELIQECKKTDSYLSFLMIDVDHFKSVNDTYGHKKGDEIIITVARTMSEVVKSHAGIPIRYAGDEFCALLPGIPKKKAQEIGEQVRAAVEALKIPIENSPEVITTSLSIGVSNFPVDSDNPDQLQSLADEAGYISKKKGRNRVSTLEDMAPQTLDATTLYRYFPCQVIVGREGILDKFGPVINPGRKKKRPIIIIHGLPGVGKTRMLDEVHSVSDNQRCFLIKMQGSPLTVGQPFIEIIEPLSRILHNYPELAAEAVSNLQMSQIQVLLPLLPTISRYTIPVAQDRALTAGQKKEIALGGLKEILITLSNKRPVLMFFDEFHFSNLGTRMLISELKNDDRASQIAVFATVCDVETVKNKDVDLLEFMTRHAKNGILEKVPLRPLDLDQARNMTNYIIKGLAEYGELIEVIHMRTEGNPGKIENLLKKLIFKNLIRIENGVLYIDEISDEDLSDLDWTKITQRSIQIDADVLQLLAKASVIGLEFTVDVLIKLVDMSDSQIYELLEKAERADIIFRTMEGDEEVFHFRSNEIKNDLYAVNPEDELKDLHRTVAEAEKEMVLGRTEKVLSRLIYHLEKAGDNDTAMVYMKDLVREFNGLFSPEQVQMYLGAELPPIEHWGDVRPLNEDEEINAIRVCKRTRIALNNMNRYPSESEIVRGSLDSAYLELERLLDGVEMVSFTEAEGELIVNEKSLHFKEKEDFDAQDFLQVMDRAHIKGMTFRQNLQRQEFLTFLHMLLNITAENLEKAGGWSELLKMNEIDNIQVSQRVFVSMGQREMMKQTIRAKQVDGIGSGSLKTITGAPSALPSTVEVSPKFLDNLKELKSKSVNPEVQKFLEDVQSILQALTLKESEMEQMETLIRELRTSRGGGSDQNRISLTRQNRQAVRETIRKGTGDVSTIENGSDPASFASQMTESQNLLLMEKIKQDVDVLIYELNYPDIEIAQMAGSALLAKGQSVVQPLTEYLINNENVIGRKTALEVIRKLEPNIGKKLLDHLVGNTDARQKAIIINIFKDFPEVPIADVSRMLIRDPDPRIRRRILQLMEKTKMPGCLEILLECLKEKNEDIVVDAIHSLGRIRNPAAIPQLAKLVEKKWLFINDSNYEAQKAACQVLGQLGGTESLAALKEVLNHKSSPPLVKWQKPPEVRAAAAYSLGYFPPAEVKPILDAAFDDPSPVVRSAVKTARFMLAGETKETHI